MRIRPYIAWERKQFRIGWRWLPSGEPKWRWRYRWGGFIYQ